MQLKPRIRTLTVGLLFGAILAGLLVSLLPASATTAASAGPPIAPTIVGGIDAPVGSWPSIAAVANRHGQPSNAIFCGGTLIHANWVVTAAHCVQGEQARSLRVFIGRTLIDSSQGETIRVRRIVRHQWNRQTDKNDIALLNLSRPSEQAVMLMVGPRKKWAYRANRPAEIAGWGGTTARGYRSPDHLKQAQVKMVAKRICFRTWYPLSTRLQACAGIWPQGKVDSCLGDSGGPLTVTDSKGRRLLAGITSFGGNRCGGRREPAVYTKVSAYRSWIRRVIRRGG